MSEIIMIYNIPEGNASVRISFNRRLFNYRVQSNSGKFDKKTNGILDTYRKPVRSTVIFNQKHLIEVTELCKKFSVGAEFYKISKIN